MASQTIDNFNKKQDQQKGKFFELQPDFQKKQAAFQIASEKLTELTIELTKLQTRREDLENEAKEELHDISWLKDYVVSGQTNMEFLKRICRALFHPQRYLLGRSIYLQDNNRDMTAIHAAVVHRQLKLAGIGKGCGQCRRNQTSHGRSPDPSEHPPHHLRQYTTNVSRKGFRCAGRRRPTSGPRRPGSSGASYTSARRPARWCSMTSVKISGSGTRGS